MSFRPAQPHYLYGMIARDLLRVTDSALEPFIVYFFNVRQQRDDPRGKLDEKQLELLQQARGEVPKTGRPTFDMWFEERRAFDCLTRVLLRDEDEYYFHLNVLAVALYLYNVLTSWQQWKEDTFQPAGVDKQFQWLAFNYLGLPSAALQELGVKSTTEIYEGYSEYLIGDVRRKRRVLNIINWYKHALNSREPWYYRKVPKVKQLCRDSDYYLGSIKIPHLVGEIVVVAGTLPVVVVLSMLLMMGLVLLIGF